MIINKTIIVVVLLVLFLSLSAFTQVDSNDKININSQRILLKSRQFIPQKGISLATKNQIEAMKTDRVHILVQVKNNPSEHEKEFLEEKGIDFLAYVPNNAWFISIPTKELDFVTSYSNIKNINLIQPDDKISSHVRNNKIGYWAIDKKTNKVNLIVKFFEDVDLDDAQKIILKHDGEVVSKINLINSLEVVLDKNKITDLANEDIVQWIEDIPPAPSKELDQSRGTIGADSAQAAPYGLNGSGITVLVYDDPIYSHTDFTNRLTNIEGGTADQHATIVAGIVGGDGTLNSNYKGIAPACTITSYNNVYPFSYNQTGNIEAEYGDAILNYSVKVAVNPWGHLVSKNASETGDPDYYCPRMGDYTTVSELFDKLVRGYVSPTYYKRTTIVFSAGNERDPNYGGICGSTYNTTNPPKSAKNIITVGGINSNDNSMMDKSSWGPVDDGRLRPDLVAPGCQTDGDEGITSTNKTNSYSIYGCGTSQAAPHVAGAVAILLQQFNITDDYDIISGADYDEDNPHPATIKALLIHTATDLGNTGPDYQYGWGLINLTYAVDQVISKNLTESEVNDNRYDQRGIDYKVPVLAGTPFLKVTLAWDDKPATPNAAKQLVNDMDLLLTAPNGTEYYPWKLDPTNPSAAATSAVNDQNGKDTLNNVEQVYVENPSEGNWTILVNGTLLPKYHQYFSLVSSSKFNTTKDYNPKVNLTNPLTNITNYNGSVSFSCSATDKEQLTDMSLYINPVPKPLKITDLTNISLEGIVDKGPDGAIDGTLWLSAINESGSYEMKGQVFIDNDPEVYHDREETINGTIFLVIYCTSGTKMNISSGEYITLTYDGGNQLNVSLPNVTNGYVVLPITDDGSTYYSLYGENSYWSPAGLSYTKIAQLNPENKFTYSQTISISGINNKTTWNVDTLPNGFYLWNCAAGDDSTYAYWIEGSSKGWGEGRYVNISVPLPNVTLNKPTNNSVVDPSDMPIVFNFSVMITHYDIENCSLWGNFSGNWELNQTKDSIPNNTIVNFDSVNLLPGNYIWNVQCYDESGQSDLGDNNFILTVSGADGDSCTSDSQCQSNYCDNDGVGLSDDNWCFTPYNTYFDGQETSYCEYSTDNGIVDCDERTTGTDLNKCVGTSYYEEECSSTCNYQDVTSKFECTDTDCSCTTSECDGKSAQATINYCDKGGQTYFQDDCGTTATAEDTDNVCRSANSLQAGDGCTSASNCNSLSTGTDLNTCNQVGQTYYEDECSASCQYDDITSVFECTETGCSCTELSCDGLTTGSDITTCASGQTYFADQCTSTAGGEDRGDNICRSSAFAGDCTADAECNNITAGTLGCNSTCDFIGLNKLYIIQNSSSHNVTYVDDQGNIVLKGTCTSGSPCTAPSDSFIIKDNGGNEVAHIDPDGNLCIETGDCSDNNATCNPPNYAFIIQNSAGTNVSYIDFTGDLCLIGSLEGE